MHHEHSEEAVSPNGKADVRGDAVFGRLHETMLDILGRIDLPGIVEAIVEHAASLVETEDAFLVLQDHDDPGQARVRHGIGVFAECVGLPVEVGSGLAQRVLASGTPLILKNYDDWDAASPRARGLGLRSCLAIPLPGESGTIGAIGLAYRRSDRIFDEQAASLVGHLVLPAALALENARRDAIAQLEIRERRTTEEELQHTIAGLQRSQRRLYLAQAEMIERLANAAEFRHAESGRNTQRMSHYAALLARRLDLSEEHCERIRVASPLHDIGKIAIPDAILLKPGVLTSAERDVVERHAEIGHKLLVGSTSDTLELAALIALTHHERYDGGGYPRQLAGETIPLEGRIASIADVFDALTSDRPYRPAMSHEEAVAIMREGKGLQFDPFMLDLFVDALTSAGATGSRSLRERLRRPAPRLRRRSPTRFPTIAAGVLVDACRGAAETLEREGGDREPIDAALRFLHTASGHKLCVSVYVLDHDRLWLISQRGYSEVRDGFSLSQGVMARAVRTGEVQFLPHVSDDSDFIGAMPGIRSEVAVPFDAGTSGVRGVFNVETIDALLPSEATRLFCPLATLFEERVGAMRDRLGLDVAELARLCVHASSLRGTQSIAEFVTRTIGRMLDLETAQLSLSRDEATFTLASYWRRPESKLGPLQSELVQLMDLERESGASAAYSLVDMTTRELGSSDRAAPWVTLLPLRVAGREIGVIAGRAPEAPAADHERIEAATLFAQHGAAVIDVAIALSREARAAVTDSLTGLLNRRGFDERIRAEIEASERTGQPFALLLADCDDLKVTNDSGGHELGDRVLQALANTIRVQKRADDVAARLGGDEFALLLLDTDRAGADTARRRIAHEIERARAALEIPLSATIGIASYPEDGTSEPELLRIADAALYAAKNADAIPAVARRSESAA